MWHGAAAEALTTTSAAKTVRHMRWLTTEASEINARGLTKSRSVTRIAPVQAARTCKRHFMQLVNAKSGVYDRSKTHRAPHRRRLSPQPDARALPVSPELHAPFLVAAVTLAVLVFIFQGPTRRITDVILFLVLGPRFGSSARETLRVGQVFQGCPWHWYLIFLYANAGVGWFDACRSAERHNTRIIKSCSPTDFLREVRGRVSTSSVFEHHVDNSRL